MIAAQIQRGAAVKVNVAPPGLPPDHRIMTVVDRKPGFDPDTIRLFLRGARVTHVLTVTRDCPMTFTPQLVYVED